MALKPFYNKKGHLGMTRGELLEKLNNGGAPAEKEIYYTLTAENVAALTEPGYFVVTLSDKEYDPAKMPGNIKFSIPNEYGSKDNILLYYENAHIQGDGTVSYVMYSNMIALGGYLMEILCQLVAGVDGGTMMTASGIVLGET